MTTFSRPFNILFLLLLDAKYFKVVQNAAANHPGQVLLSRSDGAPLANSSNRNNIA